MPSRLRKNAANQKDEITTLFDNLDDPEYIPNMKDMCKIMRETHKTLNFLAEKFDVINQKIVQIEHKNKNLIVTNNDIKNRLKKLETQHYKEQQQQLSKHLTIHGIPKKTNEDLENIITNVAKILKTDISKNNIVNYRRMFTNENMASPIIIAEFDCMETKQQIQQQFKQNGPIILKQLIPNTLNETKQIYVNEYLSEHTKKLLDDAKKLRTTHNVQFVWVRNGTVYVREKSDTKPFKVTHHDDIKAIAEQLRKKPTQ